MPPKRAAVIGSQPTLVVVDYRPPGLGPGNGPLGE
jgi:hypothetical protein